MADHNPEYDFALVVRRAKDGINGKLYFGTPAAFVQTEKQVSRKRKAREVIEAEYRTRYALEHEEYKAGKTEYKGRINKEPSQSDVDWWCDKADTQLHYEETGFLWTFSFRADGVFVSDHGITQWLRDGNYTIVDTIPRNREYDWGQPVGNEIW